MSDIVESCPLTKLNGGLSRLHSVGEDAVDHMWFVTRIWEEEKVISLRNRVSEPNISQWSQIKEDTVEVEPSVPAREFNLKAYVSTIT